MDKFSRLIRFYLRPHLGKLALVLVAALISSTSSFTYGYLSMVMVDDVLQISSAGQGGGGTSLSGLREGGRAPRDRGGLTPMGRDTVTRRDRAPGSPAGPSGDRRARRLRMLWIVFIAYVGLRLFLAANAWGYTFGIAKIGQEIVYRLRQDVYNKLQELQVSYFDRFQTGKIMARVMDDVNAVQSSISGVFIRVVTDISTLVVGIFILYHIDARLATMGILMLPSYLVVYRFFVKRLGTISRLIRERNAAVYGTIGDSVTGVRVVMSFAREPRQMRVFFGALSDFLRLQVKNSVLNTSLSVLCGLISGVGTSLILYYGILSIQSGAITLGSFLFFNRSIGFLFSPVVSLSNMNISIQQVTAALDRVFEVLDEEITIDEPEDAIHLDHVYGEVVFHNVSLQYEEDGDCALERINFGVFPGQMVCLVGASGAGKTSLVNLLLRMYDPTEGRITIDGEDIQDVALSSLRKHIRMVPQEPILFSGTLAENIRYGYPEAPPEAVVQAAKAAELHDHIMTLPGKYETHIGERGVSLSGGQRQRMALAMTLMTDPSVLILDDSTSALDAKTEKRVHDTLDRIMEDRTSFVITHKVSTARKADLVLVLDRGRIVEQGTHDRLVAKRGTYYQLFETQLSDGEKEGRRHEVATVA